MSRRSTFLISAAVLAAASSIAASAGAATVKKSPFCFAGSPTPKHICDAIKANTKPMPGPKRVKHETSKNMIGNIR